MSQIIEMEEFINTIESSVGSSEEFINDSNAYIVIYRLANKYCLFNRLQVRGCYEDIVGCERLLRNGMLDASMKQMLWDFGVFFSDNTSDNINTSDGVSRLLVVLDTWVSIQSLGESLESDDYPILPTDILIKDIDNNEKYKEIMKLLSASKFSNLQLWYMQTEVNYFSDYTKRTQSYRDRFETDEIENVTEIVKQIIDCNYITVDIIERLIEFGEELYDRGVKCIIYNDSSPSTKYVHQNIYLTLVSAFLVYLSEHYNMAINTIQDSYFWSQYNAYRKCNYCLAEDLFNNRFIYNPVMLYATPQSRKFVYIRNIDYDYTYYYFREEEYKKLLTGDTNIKPKRYSPEKNMRYTGRGYIQKSDMITDSAFADNDDSDIGIELVPLYSVFEDNESLEEAVRVFNKYNVSGLDVEVAKLVTIRDLLCTKVVEDGVEVLRIGYIQSNKHDSYNRRLAETITVSGIQPDTEDMIARSYFPLERRLNSNLFNVNYVYDLGENIPIKFRKLINNTNSWDTEVFDPAINEETGEREIICSIPEKFLYYTFSQHMLNAQLAEMKNSLTGERREYLASLYEGVYTISNVLPELTNYFELRNIIEAEVFNAYGDISPEFIKVEARGKFFDINNKLFGIMKIDK